MIAITRRRRSRDGGRFNPTPEEILLACRAIQATWDHATEQLRLDRAHAVKGTRPRRVEIRVVRQVPLAAWEAAISEARLGG